jgi:hypothetical protein
LFVVKKFGCNGGIVCVGNTGNILDLFMTKNVTEIDSIYPLVTELKFKSLAPRFGGISVICGGLKSL